MYNNSMKNLIHVLLVCLPLSCAHHDHGHQGKANQHMLQHKHEELIASFEDPARDKWQMPEKVISYLRPLSGKRVMDIGAGSGYFTARFLREGAQVVAADVDKKFLGHLEKRFPRENWPELLVRKVEYDDPMMEKRSFDFAFTSNTYHHIENRVEYLKKIREGLKVGGKLVILDFKTDPQDEKIGPPMKMRVPIAEAAEEIKKAGFDHLQVINTEFPQQYLLIATEAK